jgi:hypothetical protein
MTPQFPGDESDDAIVTISGLNWRCFCLREAQVVRYVL